MQLLSLPFVQDDSPSDGRHAGRLVLPSSTGDSSSRTAISLLKVRMLNVPYTLALTSFLSTVTVSVLFSLSCSPSTARMSVKLNLKQVCIQVKEHRFRVWSRLLSQKSRHCVSFWTVTWSWLYVWHWSFDFGFPRILYLCYHCRTMQVVRQHSRHSRTISLDAEKAPFKD